MNDNLLEDLELHADLLIESWEKLKTENIALKSQLDLLLKEKEQLVAQNQHAVNKIRQMVMRLQNIVEETA